MLKAMKNSEAVALPANRMASQSENPEKEKKKEKKNGQGLFSCWGVSLWCLSTLLWPQELFCEA